MPQKKADEPSKDAAECILKIGKNNNVVQWKEEIQNELTELYGLTVMFFTTNERYVQPFPREEDYIPDFPESDDEEEPELNDADGDGGYIFVIVDTFTRWVELFHTVDATAMSGAKCLFLHFGRFGAPCQLRSDNGPHFVADFNKFLHLEH
jgi:hypothetical protein